MAIESGGSEGGVFWAVVVAAGTLIINIIVAILNGMSTLNRARNETDEKIDTKDKQITADLIVLERRFKEDVDSAGRAVGETMAAMRTKITEVELWGRDHYVDKSTWERFEEKLDRRLDRIDQKLDQIVTTKQLKQS
jgi:hypothetical protein